MATRHASCPEHYIRGYLDALGVDYVYQYVVDGVMLADFFIPAHNLILEYDGSYWHMRSAVQDGLKNEKLEALGLRILRVTEMTLAERLREEFAAEQRRQR
jgi:very-short-patch-repair endonuclease